MSIDAMLVRLLRKVDGYGDNEKRGERSEREAKVKVMKKDLKR